MGYVCAIDTGGTFTDCVVLDDDGRLVQTKSPTTPDDFSRAVFEAIELAAQRLELTLSALLEDTAHLLVGTTVGTNAVVQRRGAKVGMLVTRGHGDAIHIMRGHGRVAGRPVAELLAPFRTAKPDPLVPRALVAEVDERVDSFGDVVVGLDGGQVREAVATLAVEGVESVAVCFLWSFLNPEHEAKAKAIVAEAAPALFVSASNDVAPRWGEYERWAATAINAYLGPLVSGYVESIERRLRELGYRRQLLLMSCSGGSLPAEQAKRLPLLLLGSGPVGGLIGSGFLAQALAHPNVITTDMGGTSFDAGLIYGYEPVRTVKSTVDGYEYFVPNVEVRSIGSGGGSIAWVDGAGGRLRVGPRSAGAEPGPACYGRGGTEPTVTDANLVLGLINPDYFLGGAIQLDGDAAHTAIARVAAQVGMDPVETASGIVRITDAHMADLLRKMTIEKGFHPEDFVVYSYGGAGGLHCSAFAREIGIRRIIVPLSNSASVWSAFGISASDVFHVFEATEIVPAPFPVDLVNGHLEKLEREARKQLAEEGVRDEDISLRRLASIRYSLQFNDLTVPLPDGTIREASLAAAIDAFERTYEERYGAGAGYRDAGFELVSLLVEATGRLPKPTLAATVDGARAPAASDEREVYWAELGRFAETPVYRESGLGTEPLSGPAVMELPTTTIAVRPGDRCWQDGFGNLLLEVDAH